jgi:hypothetical protein
MHNKEANFPSGEDFMEARARLSVETALAFTQIAVPPGRSKRRRCRLTWGIAISRIPTALALDRSLSLICCH